MPAATEQGINFVSQAVSQVIAAKLAVFFHVPDNRLNRTASPQLFLDCWRDPAFTAGNKHSHLVYAIAAVASIHIAAFGLLVSHSLHLGQCLL